MRRLLILAAVAGALLPVPASAHPYLVSAVPAAGSTVPASPAQIVIAYTEPLDAAYCSVSLVAPDGAEVRTTVSASWALLTATPPLLGPGTYVVHWSAVGADGHRVLGDFAFNVGHASANPAAAALGVDYRSSTGSSLAEETGRDALTVTTILLAGLLLLGGLALPPDPEVRAVAARRLRRLVRGAWTAQLAVVLALVALLVRWNGLDALLPSVTGQLVVLRGLLTLAAAPAVLGDTALARGRTPSRGAFAYGALVAGALLGALALSGHALARGDGRTLDLAVLGVHLGAVSVWVGALVAVVAAAARTGTAGAGTHAAAAARRLTPAVAVSLPVLVVTGLYNAHVNLRGLGGLTDSAYGRVLDAKVALVVATVALGGLAAWRRRAPRGPVPPQRRAGRGLLGTEAAAAVAVVALAGALAQVPNPASLPYPSQVAPRDAGSLFLTASNGRHLVALTVAPGVAGANRVIAAVQRTDDNDMTVPAEGTDGVDMAATCTCAPAAVRATLVPHPGGAWWTADVSLPAGHWTFSVRPHVAGVAEPFADATGDVMAPPGQGEAVVGVAGDLSGVDGQACQDRAVGLQAAAVEANVAAVVNGDPLRVVAADTEPAGAAAAVAKLASLGATLLAEPCGDEATVSAVETAAARRGIAVVGDLVTADGRRNALDTGLSPDAGAAALADQVRSQQATDVTVLEGGDRADAAETAALAGHLAALRIRTRVLPMAGADAATLAGHVRTLDPQCVVFVGRPDVALPVIRAFGALQPAWSPAHAAIASAQLMSNRLAGDAGDWVTFGRVSFASELDPDDVPGVRYASDMDGWFGGRRPTIDGARGYVAGWLVANAFRNASDVADPVAVLAALHTHFGDFSLGQSYHLTWSATGRGGADRIAFYTTVFTNPLTLIGAPSATNHAGIFLKTGAYVRVTPYRTAAVQE